MSEAPFPAVVSLDVQTAALIEAMYRNERPSLLRRLARRHGLELAEDLVHQVFVRLAGRSQAADSIAAPVAFLAEAAHNAACDQARTLQRQHSQNHVSLDQVQIAANDPVRHLEARDRLRRLESALDRLKPMTRNIFLARRLDGYSYAEIAERTGLSVRAVEKQMSRAIHQLAKQLGEP